MQKRDILQQTPQLRSILKKKKTVTWGYSEIREIPNREDQKISERLIKCHKENIVSVLFSKFEGCTILKNENFSKFLDKLDAYFLRPLDKNGALKNTNLNLEIVAEMAFEYTYLHKNNSNRFFKYNVWTLHFNQDKAATELTNNIRIIADRCILRSPHNMHWKVIKK